MANNHGYVSTARTMSQDVDALNRVGVINADTDNGVLVTITKMKQTDGKVATGFEYEVEKATGTPADDALYIVDTPEVGSDIEMQELSDPRYFYNKANRPLSIKKLMKGVDEIEVTKECFTDNTLPTASKTHITIGDGGKMTAAAAATNAYFDLVALHHIAIGMETVQTAILKYTGKQS